MSEATALPIEPQPLPEVFDTLKMDITSPYQSKINSQKRFGILTKTMTNSICKHDLSVALSMIVYFHIYTCFPIYLFHGVQMSFG